MKLEAKDILFIHEQTILLTGGTPGVLNISLLESATQNIYSTFDGKELYPGTIQKAARLCYGIISNHPFVDGNKRTGVGAMLLFLKHNGISFSFSDNDLVELGLSVARREAKEKDIVLWIEKHICK